MAYGAPLVIEPGVDQDVIVCDNGTGFVKVGFAGANFPTCMFPSMVGTPIMQAGTGTGSTSGLDLTGMLVGDDAAAERQQLQIKYPLSNGIVRDWESMQLIYDYTFDKKLQCGTKDKWILLTEAPLNPKTNRERIVEMMFETYQFSHVYVATQAVLGLYAQGITTAIVLDAGDGVTHMMAVYKGHSLPKASARLDLAGRSLTGYLVKLLRHRGYNFNQSADFETVREIKESLCYTAFNYAAEMRLAQETTTVMHNYVLPDGRRIVLGDERFRAPEALFSPAHMGIESPGVHELLYKSIRAAPTDTQANLYRCIVLSGGTTMFPGFSSRLVHEVQTLFQADKHAALRRRPGASATQPTSSRIKIRVEDSPRRRHLVFLGGAVLAKLLRPNPALWIQRSEWEDQGARATMFGKCFSQQH